MVVRISIWLPDKTHWILPLLVNHLLDMPWVYNFFKDSIERQTIVSPQSSWAPPYCKSEISLYHKSISRTKQELGTGRGHLKMVQYSQVRRSSGMMGLINDYAFEICWIVSFEARRVSASKGIDACNDYVGIRVWSLYALIKVDFLYKYFRFFLAQGLVNRTQRADYHAWHCSRTLSIRLLQKLVTVSQD